MAQEKWHKVGPQNRFLSRQVAQTQGFLYTKHNVAQLLFSGIVELPVIAQTYSN